MNKNVLFVIACLQCFSGTALKANDWYAPDPGCESYTAWQIQSNVRSDPTGFRNIAFPEGGATYWGTVITEPLGSSVTLQGRFPNARYMALQVYDEQRNVLGFINDQNIVPDAGTNNPFVSGSSQGTYTVQVVFGKQPFRGPAVNTIYTNNLTQVLLLYRIYASDSPNDLTAGTFNPVLPNIYVGGNLLATCPPRPIITPETLTVWGRTDLSDFIGTAPPPGTIQGLATSPPPWLLTVTNSNTPYYPSADNSYMEALISRKFLAPPFSYDMVVVTMHAPTFPNTQLGEAPYLASTSRQVRFWSICQYDPVSTGVNRCVADYQAAINPSGFVTVVISDPSKQPSASTLAAWGAEWMSWGALQSGDSVYDVNLNPVGNADGVYYYGFVLYRQTISNPGWAQSMTNIGSNYPLRNMKAAMGDYWPQIGYCTAANFASLGAACMGQQ